MFIAVISVFEYTQWPLKLFDGEENVPMTVTANGEKVLGSLSFQDNVTYVGNKFIWVV